METMTRQELLDIIDQAEREGWEELDLQGKRIEKLPSEIGRLTGLERLAIGYKGLVIRPGDRNPLRELPPEIGQLLSLTSLNLSFNQLTAIPSEIGQLASLTSLDLYDNKLTAVPLEIGQLLSLTSLSFNSNQLTAVPSEIGQLTSLAELRLENNRLTAVPPEIGQLTSLTELGLENNQLTVVPLEIGQLTNLRNFSFGGNQLKTIPLEIGQLTSLIRLDLWGNQLTAVPPEIGQLTNLGALYLYDNQLTTVPSEIGQLTRLEELSLSGNQLTAVPPEIGQLASLNEFDLSSNQLTGLPPEIGQLASLTELYLNDNQLTGLPPEIGQLASLTAIYLNNNQLTGLPSEIGQLTSLESLDLSDNQLTTLSPALYQLSNLKRLRLYDNPLPLSPELLGDWHDPGDPQIILDTYFADSRPLREAKLLLVGEGSVGKTSIVERLLHDIPPSDNGRTEGVDIHHCLVDKGQLIVDREQLAVDSEEDGPIRLNIWDFGGQDIYHATHQFFLTHRSIYLIVLESRKDERASPLEYWLAHVANFAGDAPVIVVANKCDQHPMRLDERGLMLKHRNIKAIIHTSCTKGTGINELRQAIVETLTNLPHLNDWVPLTWFAVKKKLAELDKDYLPYETYVELCQAESIEHEPAQRALARYLHDLGAALHFQDDPYLAGTNVLNPEWVTGGIYRILTAEDQISDGILRLDDLANILENGRYPHHKHPFLLDIMGKFELCVPLGDKNHYLIPGQLSLERPDFAWPGATATAINGVVALEYRYTGKDNQQGYAILPPSVFSRLMVRLHAHIWSDEHGRPIRWRDGMILAYDGCRALIVASPNTTPPRITISLDGPSSHHRQLLAIIRAELDTINASFAKLGAEMWVPIPGYTGKAIRYQALLNLEAKGETAYYDADNDLDLNVGQLLNGIESEAMRRARQIQERLRRCHPAELNEIAMELGVSDEALAAAVNAKQPTNLMRLLEHKDRPGEWLLRLVRTRSGGSTYIKEQTIVQGDATMSKQKIDISGPVSGSGGIVSIGNTMTNVVQTVNNMTHANASDKKELEELVKQLFAELDKAPPEAKQEVKAIEERAKRLVDAASADQPDPVMVEVTGEGLQNAAKNIAAVMPTVLAIATQIVATVSRIVG